MRRTNDELDFLSDSAGWADATTLAHMLGCSARHVKRLARSKCWEYRLVRGNGGSRPEYDLSKLPADILCKIESFTTGHRSSDATFPFAYEQRLVLEAPVHERRKREKYQSLYILVRTPPRCRSRGRP